MSIHASSQSTGAIAPGPAFTPLHSGMLQRKCACGGTPGATGECDECSEKRLSLQRRNRNSELETGNNSFAPPIVHEVLRSHGQPLDRATLAFMEPRFGQDFSQVRVHTDAKAADSAHAVNALAYTVGPNLVFGTGQYAPQTSAGQRLMAHELAHIVQQHTCAPASGGDLAIGAGSDSFENAAETAADGIIVGGDVGPSTTQARALVLARKSTGTCSTTFSKAKSFKDLVDLVRAAESKLKAAGITSTADQVKTLRGIYYGTPWSLDFRVEKSVTRNVGFQLFTQSPKLPADPTTILDCGLFGALQASQDVVDGGRHVDFGHLIIALDARNAPVPSLPFPGFGGTGTEIVTWLGDLGGGAASLALDRVKAPKKSVSAKFSGSDYGGSINLEGDVAGFVVGRGGAITPVAPVFPLGKGIADVLQDYLSPGKPGSEWKDRATTFLKMHGGVFNTSASLTNRAALITKFASKIETFACQYLAARAKDGRITTAAFKAAADHVIPSSQEVGETFVDALDDCHMTGAKLDAKRFPAPKAAVPGACSMLLGAMSAAKKAGELLEDAERKAGEIKKEVEGWWKNLKVPW